MQIQKPEIQRRILSEAARLFATQGFPVTTIAKIASAAGISTGNVYRYFKSKEELLHGVLPEPLVDEFRGLLKARIRSWKGVNRQQDFPLSASFFHVTEMLLSFCMSHHWALVLLLGNASGTPWADFRGKLETELLQLTLEHFRQVAPVHKLSVERRECLHLIYSSMLDAVVGILRKFERQEQIRAALEALSRYHLAGLRGFFENELEASTHQS